MRKRNFTRQSKKVLNRLLKTNPGVAKKLIKAIDHLCLDPTHGNTEKLSNHPGYRVREGKYRIVYDFNEHIVKINLIDHRKDIYRKLRR